MSNRYFRAPGDDDDDADEEEEELMDGGEGPAEMLPAFIDVDLEEEDDGQGEGTKESPVELEEVPRAPKAKAPPQPLARQLNLDAERFTQMVSMFGFGGAEEQPVTGAEDGALILPADGAQQTFFSTGPVAVLPRPPRDLAKLQRIRLTRPSKSVTYSAIKQVSGDKVKELQDYPNVLLSSSFRVGWGPNGRLVLPNFVRPRTCLPDTEVPNRLGRMDLDESEYPEPCSIRLMRISATMAPDLSYAREQYLPMLNVLRQHTSFAPDTKELTPSTTVTIWDGTVHGSRGIPNDSQREEFTSLLAECCTAAEKELECHQTHARRSMNALTLAHPFPLSLVHEVALRQMVDVWALLAALWGDDQAKEKPPADLPIGAPQVCERLRRRRQLNDWLHRTTSPRVDADLRAVGGTGDPHSQALLRIFLLLTGHRVEEAASLAMENGDLRLAMLLTAYDSLAHSPQGNADLQKQLQLWQEQGSASLMNSAMYDVYRLLAGDLTVLQETLGDMFDWQRSFGCFIWYSFQDPKASVEDCVREYLAHSAAKVSNPWPTCPAYIQELPLIRDREDVADGSTEEFLLRRMHANSQGHDDLAYLLLALHCESSSKRKEPTALLSPLTHTYCSLDYRFLGPLLLLLSRLGMGPTIYGAVQTVLYDWAAQLEMEGLWHEALFVLLHLPPTAEYPHLREAALKAILRRHCFRLEGVVRRDSTAASRRAAKREVRLEEWSRDFLTEKLRLPSKWVDEALSDFQQFRMQALATTPAAGGRSGGWAEADGMENGVVDQPLDAVANYCEMLKLVEKHLKNLSHAA